MLYEADIYMIMKSVIWIKNNEKKVIVNEEKAKDNAN